MAKESEGLLTEKQTDAFTDALAILLGESTKGRIIRALIIAVATATGILSKSGGPDLLLSLIR